MQTWNLCQKKRRSWGLSLVWFHPLSKPELFYFTLSHLHSPSVNSFLGPSKLQIVQNMKFQCLIFGLQAHWLFTSVGIWKISPPPKDAKLKNSGGAGSRGRGLCLIFLINTYFTIHEQSPVCQFFNNFPFQHPHRSKKKTFLNVLKLLYDSQCYENRTLRFKQNRDLKLISFCTTFQLSSGSRESLNPYSADWDFSLAIQKSSLYQQLLRFWIFTRTGTQVPFSYPDLVYQTVCNTKRLIFATSYKKKWFTLNCIHTFRESCFGY